MSRSAAVGVIGRVTVPPWQRVIYFLRFFAESLRIISRELSTHSRIDIYIAVVAVLALATFVPVIPRSTENPRQLAAFVNDEPFLTMALEATREFPWGNPANYFKEETLLADNIPMLRALSSSHEAIVFSSGDEDGSVAQAAFDGIRGAWRSAPGRKHDRIHIGMDLGAGSSEKVREVHVTWVEEASTPEVLGIEVSDDGNIWREVAEFQKRGELEPAGNVEDRVVLPETDAHRFWRVIAKSDTESTRVAIEELAFMVDNPVPGRIPEHWGSIRYGETFYYGGAYFLLAAPIYAVLRAADLPAFPTGPILLRCISVIAGVWSLVLLYNFGAARLGKLPAIAGCLFLLSDSFFVYYTSIIHPDTLQLFFGLLALIVAIKHVETASNASLFALGLLAGVIQGTKVGGPWLMPMTILAIWWGFGRRREGIGISGLVNSLVKGMTICGVGGLFGWFLSTPYAFLGSWYFDTLFAVWGMVSESHLQEVSISHWVGALARYWGAVYVAIVALGLIWAVWPVKRAGADRGLALAAVLAVSQLFWFAFTGKLWVQLGYMLVGFGLVGVIGAGLLLRPFIIAPFELPRLRLAIGALLILTLLVDRIPAVMPSISKMLQWKQSTVVAVNNWATNGGIPTGKRIVHDDLAYFSPDHFPHAKMHGGVLRWADLVRYLPDYVVLSSSLYGAPWYRDLIASLPPHDDRAISARLKAEDPTGMNLYYDLLAIEEPTFTGIGGIELIKTIAPMRKPGNPFDRSEGTWQRAILSLFEQCGSNVVMQWLCDRLKRAFTIVYMHTVDEMHEDGRPTVGPELRIFRMPKRPVAISSGHLAGYVPEYAFDTTGNAWNVAEVGDAAEGAYIGLDFGSNNEVRVRSVTVKWIYAQSTPREVGIEYSDDGEVWLPAADFAISYEASEPNWKESELTLPPTDPHRYWRLVARDVADRRRFGLSELQFFDELGDALLWGQVK